MDIKEIKADAMRIKRENWDIGACHLLYHHVSNLCDALEARDIEIKILKTDHNMIIDTVTRQAKRIAELEAALATREHGEDYVEYPVEAQRDE